MGGVTPRRRSRLGHPGGSVPGSRARSVATIAWLRAGLVAAAVLALDQVSKQAVENSITPGTEQRFLPGVELVNTRNHGVAFGFLPGSDLGVSILIGAALVALLVYFARNTARTLIWLPTGLLLGGAIGNIVDRARQGAVTDFIKLPLGWPPFNLADASITIGIVLLVLLIEHARHARA
jgi:signal peptidase II